MECRQGARGGARNPGRGPRAGPHPDREGPRAPGARSRPRALTAALDELLKSQSWFRRRRFRRYHEQVMEVVRRDAQGPRRQWFESLLEGYGLMQNRLRRVMQAEAIERIDCLGREVDPELMIVRRGRGRAGLAAPYRDRGAAARISLAGPRRSPRGGEGQP